ncbi:MAG: polyamine aminopropyltransferase [Planctomycetes bacterium]|nr:polyamine aminopropyltransferase [Planctomycetota bacterium]
MEKPPLNWIDDYFSEYELHKLAFKNILYQAESKHQKIIIVDTHSFGRCLILDNEFQSSEADEYIYHESLVQPSLIMHSEAQNVLIIGGGEGATLRETLRHQSVKKAVMVDISDEVISCAKKHLPSFHEGAFDDKRTTLVIEDGRKYLEKADQQFDVIIIDVNDPVEGSPSAMLFTRECYQIAAGRLRKDGIIVVQSGAVSITDNDLFSGIFHTLSEVFPHVFPYITYIPSYACLWGFILATHNLGNLDITDEEIDSRIKNRVHSTLRYYDSITHHSMFNLPKYLRKELEDCKHIIRDNEPLIKHYPGVLPEKG